MKLNQAIVIVNEFSVPTPSGGSRGSSPGFYVERYMMRPEASEGVCVPAGSGEHSDYVMRYMMRTDAADALTDVSVTGRAAAVSLAKGVQTSERDGLSFGPGNLAYTYAEAKEASKRIQRAFDGGKTVMKTVISFDTDYLKQEGLIPEDLVVTKRGDLRGQCDQLRLRDAISHGMTRLAHRFDNLEWVGVIQSDTKHIHCHIAAVDLGEGRVREKDGQQSGMLSKADRALLRRSIADGMERTRDIPSLARAVSLDRQNVAAHVRERVMRDIGREGVGQFLLACLPEDRRKWRAGSRAKDMRKANAIAGAFVDMVMAEPDSGFDTALRDISAYAGARRDREGLSEKAYRKLIDTGTKNIRDKAINAVYGELKTLDPEVLTVRTAIMDMMSEDFEVVSSTPRDDFTEFTYRLRAYSQRKDRHKNSKKRMTQMREELEKQMPEADEAALVVFDFLDSEIEYESMALAKYQYFLQFAPLEEDWSDGVNAVRRAYDSVAVFDAMTADEDIVHSSSVDEAYALSMDRYGLAYGNLVRTGDRDRLEEIRQSLVSGADEMFAQTAKAMADDGLTLTREGEGGAIKVRRRPPHDFDDVKAVDLHDMAEDEPSGASRIGRISRIHSDFFIRLARKRQRLVDAAKKYFVDSGQAEAVGLLPVDDIERMNRYADALEKGEDSAPEKPAEGGGGKGGRKAGRKASYTFPLGSDVFVSLKQAMRKSLAEKVDEKVLDEYNDSRELGQ